MSTPSFDFNGAVRQAENMLFLSVAAFGACTLTGKALYWLLASSGQGLAIAVGATVAIAVPLAFIVALTTRFGPWLCVALEKALTSVGMDSPAVLSLLVTTLLSQVLKLVPGSQAITETIELFQLVFAVGVGLAAVLYMRSRRKS